MGVEETIAGELCVGAGDVAGLSKAMTAPLFGSLICTPPFRGILKSVGFGAGLFV